MDRGAFTAGVEPGGLIDQTEIKILICHVLDRLGNLLHDDLLEVLAGHGYANYFESASALAELCSSGLILLGEEGYSATEKGSANARLLAEDLPLTVRERVLADAAAAQRRRRNQKSHKVAILETENGFRLRCAVCEASGSEPFAIELDAPTRAAALRMRDNFIDNAEDIMRDCLSRLSGETL